MGDASRLPSQSLNSEAFRKFLTSQPHPMAALHFSQLETPSALGRVSWASVACQPSAGLWGSCRDGAEPHHRLPQKGLA